jgi:hypothetical protein
MSAQKASASRSRSGSRAGGASGYRVSGAGSVKSRSVERTSQLRPKVPYRVPKARGGVRRTPSRVVKSSLGSPLALPMSPRRAPASPWGRTAPTARACACPIRSARTATAGRGFAPG